MALSRLEPELLNHLRVVFGSHGVRAVEFLESAERFLDEMPVDVPRRGEVVAYCIREALTEIPKASGVGADSEWRQLSREVVKTFDRYDEVGQSTADDELQALARHREAVEGLRRFHEEGEGVHEARLFALMMQRAGVEPLSTSTSPVADYQLLVADANTAAHDSCPVDAARGLWERCVALLRQMFLPHELRSERLVVLAAIDEPTLDDLGEVLDLSGTSVHVQRFLRQVSSPRWLWLFVGERALGEAGGVLWGAACTAAARLADSHRTGVVLWLNESFDLHSDVDRHARCFAHAAHRVGGDALELLLRIVRQYPEDDQIVHSGTSAAGELEATHPLVQQFADILLNESSWDRVMIADGLASHLASGVNEQNALDRVGMLCHKLARIPDDDMALGQLRYETGGLISEAHTVFPRDRSSVLLGCLTKMIRSAWEWQPAEALLERLDVLPATLRDRYRAWVLAIAADASTEAMTAEVEQAIARRDATGDDAALVDRAVDVADRDDLVRRWREAMGAPPSVAETSRVLGSDEQVPREWFRASTWAALLPPEATGPWIGPCRILAARYGQLTRESLLQRSTVESRSIDSAYTAAELNSMTPAQAALAISSWRPAPGDLQLGALELARELENAIQEAPESWLSDPLNIAAALRHPLYISHYLRSAAKCADADQQTIDGLIDVIDLVRGEPWPAANLGERFVDAGWHNAHAAAVGLIAAFCRSGAAFGERADDVWSYLEASARDPSEPPWPSDGPRTAEQARTSAINRVSTRAFEAALVFVDFELRDSRPLRPQFEQLLDLALRLEGNDGVEYRAAIAPHILWLRHRMPEWTQGNVDNLYGPSAPAELGRLTFEVTVQFGRVDEWLLESYSQMLQDAAVRGTRNALRLILIGMLRHYAGYTTSEIATFLQEHRELIGQTGALLPNLLCEDDIEQADLDTGMELWQALLDSTAAEDLSEFGWMSQVESLDDDTWSQLTLQTLSATGGRIDWARQVAERAMKPPVTLTKITIMKEIVQGEADPWTLSRITDNIEEFFDTAGELRDTDEYARLRTALQERDLID